MKDLIQIAIQELGEKEVKGKKNNPKIVKYAKEAGFDWVNDDETPWCSIFVNWCAKKAKLSHSKKADARSWLEVGSKTSNPEPGDIVVFWRGRKDSWQGHVGIFMGYAKKGDRIYTLGGNQGNMVSITAYPSNKLLGFRRLKNFSSKVGVPDPTLKKGSTGDMVKQLQDMLKIVGYECGTSDGIFGKATEKAVKKLQSSEGITADGIYGKSTKNLLTEALQA